MPSACLRTTGIKKVGIISVFVVLLCILGTTKAVSETQLPDTIKLGVRTTIPIISSFHTEAGKEIFGGFCYEFAKELEKELQEVNQNTKVVSFVIKNEYLGLKYSRWGSLITNVPKDMRDLQCGPNSRQIIEGNSIIFSDSNFYETGIKILIKKEILDKYSIDQNTSNLPSSLETIKTKILIGAVEETTTLKQLKAYKYKHKKDGYKTRDEALDALKLGNIEAFASDGILLRFLMESGNGGGTPYQDQGYVIFPEGADYLAGETEKYAIAISNVNYDNRKNALYSNELQSKVDKVLNQQKFKVDEKNKLKQYETGQVKNPLENILIGIAKFAAGLALFGIILFLIKRFNSKPPTSSPVNFTIHINMNQDLAKVVPQIQELVEELKKQGLTTEVAKEKVAKDIATQAQSDPTKKEKLLKWVEAESLKTVSNVATEIFKIAIRSIGIPLP